VKCSACSPNDGADCNLRKMRIKLVCQCCATSRKARSRNRSESRMDSQCGIDAMWRDRCDACSCREERGRLTRCRRLYCGAALSQPEYRSSADPGSHATIRATERTTSQSYRRTPTSIATYSVSRNPEVTPPLQLPRCELRAEPWFVQFRSHVGQRSVRFVTSALRQSVQPSNESDDPSAQLDHPVHRAALLRRQLLQLQQLRFGQERRQRIVDRVLQ
jgi:hypothetical protein